jgi:hypothetical protein
MGYNAAEIVKGWHGRARWVMDERIPRPRGEPDGDTGTWRIVEYVALPTTDWPAWAPPDDADDLARDTPAVQTDLHAPAVTRPVWDELEIQLENEPTTCPVALAPSPVALTSEQAVERQMRRLRLRRTAIAAVFGTGLAVAAWWGTTSWLHRPLRIPDSRHAP